MSQNRGTAPRKIALDAVETNVMSGATISSPGRMPRAAIATTRADEPELTAMPCLAPTRAANRRSNSSTFGPKMIHPDLTTSAAPAGSFASNHTRARGTFRLRCVFSLESFTDDGPHRLHSFPGNYHTFTGSTFRAPAS